MATAVVAGAGGYYAGLSSAPAGTTKTETTTTTVSGSGGGTTTVTVTGSGSQSSTTSTTTGSSSTSSGASPWTNYPDYVITWPFDLRVTDPVSGLSGNCKAVQFNTIPYQSDATIPGTRAFAVQAAMKAVYPSVNWTNFNAGADMSSVFTALTAGQNNWDVARGTGLAWPALGFLEPITDFFNAWADKDAIPPIDVDSATFKGDIYMLPDDGGPHAGWWRKDLFAEAGAGTFDYKTFEYTGTKPNDMGYTELSQTIAKITQMGSSRSVYGTYIPSNAAILGPWYVDSFIRANGGLRYYGDSQSCTITMDQAPFANNVLDTMKFLQSNLPNYVPGGATLDLNALITEITTGSLGFFFGPDPNLDGQMAKTAANKSNPKAPDGVNVRNCIQPTTGWSNGKPLDPKLPPSIKFVSWAGILRGSTNPKASWEWLRTYCGFNAEMGLVGNAAGIPERLDVGKIIASDPRLDIAEWIAATTGNTYVDAPIQATFGPILATAYTNAIDPFLAGTGTAEQAVANFVQAATSGLQKAGIPAAPGPAP